jgi:hypothetical protein
MGGSNSKAATEDPKKDKGSKFLKGIKSNVEDEFARRMMIQREVGMAVNLAQARDMIWIFGSAWATFGV